VRSSFTLLRQRPSATPFPTRAAILSVLFLAVSIAAVAYFLRVASVRENDIVAENSHHIARTALEVLHEQVNNWAKDYAWWDATVDFAVDGANVEWAEGNIGKYLQETYGITGTYLLEPGGGTLFHSADGKVSKRPVRELLGDQTERYLARVQDTSLAESQTVSAFQRADGKVYAVAAAPVTPENPTPEQLVAHPRPVLVLYKELDADTIAGISRRFLLNDLRLGTAPLPPGEAGFELKNLADQAVATVRWSPARPGDKMFSELLTRISVVAVILTAAALAVFLGWWRTASEANEAKSRFLAKMSHELRTPLNPIIGFSEAMARGDLGELPEHFKGYAEDILRSGRHLAEIVDDILDLARIESGELEIAEAPVDFQKLKESLPGARMMSDPRLRHFNGADAPEIVWHIADGMPRLLGDELRIRQVLLNLLSNAVKFSDGKEIAVTIDTDGGAARIVVADQGVGISRDDLGKLFTPFVQVGSDMDKRSHGTGLGLAISRELMALHQGTLELGRRLIKFAARS
jgi:signal transduction histidine kinase